MRDPIAGAEQEMLRAVQQLEAVTRRLWPVASRLEQAADGAGGPEVVGLAGLLGSVLVDRLHPAIDALRGAMPGSRPPATNG